MLKFIFGRAACGKTYEIIKLVEKSAKAGERPLLLVPEQFSFESEKLVLDALGDCDFQNVTVTSFTRLCSETEQISGGICFKSLSDADKHILMQRAVKSVSSDLKLWAKYFASPGFADEILKTVEEFKLQGIYPEDLKEASNEVSGEKLRLKLSDTALIYSEYNALTAESFLDPSDRLERLCRFIETDDYFKNRPVFVDSFKGFTGQQFKLLKKIISQSPSVTIAVTYDPDADRQYGVFHNISKTVNKLKAYAEENGVAVSEPVTLRENKYNCADLRCLEAILSGSGKAEKIKAPDITVCRADSIYDEAEFVARNIRKTVREENAAYGDFVVIARDTAPYMNALKAACERNGVSCFFDMRLALASMPVSTAVMGAVETAAAFTGENILKFLKSGINIADETDISDLENYAYIWNLSSADWQREWDMNPDGLSSRMEEKQISMLKHLNEIRVKAVKPLTEFKSCFKGTPRERTKAIMELLSLVKAPETFAALSDELSKKGDFTMSDAVRSSWDAMISVFNTLTACFPDTQISSKDYINALKSAISFTTVGVIPQMADEVAFGSADRIRPSRPKYAFILGANQGVFPKGISNSGVFGLNERKELIDLGLDIADRTLEASIDEDFLVYSNLCCASDKVFVSYCAVLADGSQGMPSPFVSEITENLDCITVNEPQKLSLDNAPETERGAFFELCRRMSFPDETQTVLACNNENLNEKAKWLGLVRNAENARLSSDTAKKLFGQRIKMSPTKFDDLSHCRFKYFLKYGLNARRIYPAEMNAMQKGTLIHYVLQKMIEEYGKGIGELDKAKIKESVDRYTDEYLDGIQGYRSTEIPRLKYIVSNIRRSLYCVVMRLSEEFAQSDFIPVKCELKIGDDGEVPAIDIPLDDHGSVSLEGTVDRVDEWNGYIRVIDYKSGSKTFKLPDILFGQNMQMLLYLYTLVKFGTFGKKPAGVLYMKAKRNTDGKNIRMDGMVLDDESVVYAMERENGGKFIPKYGSSRTAGSFITDNDFEDIFAFIELKLKNTAQDLLNGSIEADPIDGIESSACEYCDFACVCKTENNVSRSVEKLTKDEVIERIREENKENV